MDIDQSEIKEFIKRAYPNLSLNNEEAKTLWLGSRVLEEELGNKDYEKVPSHDSAELLYTAKRDLDLLAYQQKFKVDNQSWNQLLNLTILNSGDNHSFVRNDAVYRVKTSKGEGVLVVCTGKDFHYFSFYNDKGLPPKVYHLMCIGEYEIDKQTPGKIEADLERVTETETEIALRGLLEAKDWIIKNWIGIDDKTQDGIFAGHIFDTKERAIGFVSTLYQMGAKKVLIAEVRPYSEMEPERPYADELIVKLPDEPQKRQEIFSFLNNYMQDGIELEPCEHYEEKGQKTISVYWEY